MSFLVIQTAAGAPPPLGPAEGTVPLADGRALSYTYHADRNSLLETHAGDGAVIARTSSGNLLRFDLATLKLTHEHIESSQVTCLGAAAGGAVLVGFDDGRVSEVKPGSLDLKAVARLPGPPRWISARSGALVAVVEEGGKETWVHDLGAKKRHRLLKGGGAYLLDRRGRLWIGVDQGEWGGACSTMDLRTGVVTDVGRPPSGVYGFIERANGEVWAYGGMLHLGISEGFIARVDGGTLRVLATFTATKPGTATPTKPRFPVTHVLEEPATRKLVVISFSDVFRTGPDLASWEHLTTLPLTYRGGRPDAMGAYPALRSAHLVSSRTEPLRLVASTSGDGVVELAGGRVRRHSLPDQLGVGAVARIQPSAEGVLFLPWSAEESPWRRHGTRWQPFDLTPPFEVPSERWYQHRIHVGEAGALTTVSQTNATPGTLTVLRWRAGLPEVVAREDKAMAYAAYSVSTPDGQLWIAYPELRRLTDGRWETVGGKSDAGLLRLRSVGASGPPWILHVPSGPGGRLLRLVPPTRGANARIEPVTYAGRAAPAQVRDAIVWTSEELLLVTERGLERFHSKTGALTPLPGAPPEGKLLAACTDGLGRLWVAGDLLAVSDDGGNTFMRLDGLPMMSPTWIKALSVDPQKTDGVILSLWERGVLFLRLPKRP